MILGGGSPKNFVLQTEPQIQEVLGIDERGHDFFLQITDARPDTGGLSGATPAEAVSWGKIDPDRLPDAVVCYLDSTVALPLLTSYALGRHAPRPLKRLYERRGAMMQRLRDEYVRRSGEAQARSGDSGTRHVRAPTRGYRSTVTRRARAPGWPPRFSRSDRLALLSPSTAWSGGPDDGHNR